MRSAAGRDWGLLGAGVLLAVGAIALSVARPRFEGDTISLAAGVDRAFECLGAGVAPCPDVGAYSLQQTAVIAAAKSAGLAPITTGRVLAALSGLSFATLVFLFAVGLPSSARLTGMAALATSPLAYYARSTFGELLAAAALTGFVVSVRSRRVSRPWHSLWIALAAGVASLGKDTLPPFVLLLGFVAHCSDSQRQQGDGVRRIAATAAGSVAGASAFAAFHWFRVGALYNTEYVGRPEFFLASVHDVGSAFLGHWLSPSAGLLWMWPLSAVVLMGDRRGRLLPLAVVVAYAAGLSLWWSPFGWIAWGDRLLYPIVCAAIFIALASRGDTNGTPSRALIAVMASACLPALATWSVTADQGALLSFFAADARFPGPPTIQADAGLYRDFLRHLTWERRFDVFALFAPLATPLGAAIVGVAGLATALILRSAVLMKLQTPREGNDDHPGSPSSI